MGIGPTHLYWTEKAHPIGPNNTIQVIYKSRDELVRNPIPESRFIPPAKSFPHALMNDDLTRLSSNQHQLDVYFSVPDAASNNSFDLEHQSLVRRKIPLSLTTSRLWFLAPRDEGALVSCSRASARNQLKVSE